MDLGGSTAVSVNFTQKKSIFDISIMNTIDQNLFLFYNANRAYRKNYIT